MFAGFNVKISTPEIFFPHFYNHGVELYESQKNHVQKRLKNYALDGEVISASKIEEDWFPSIKANVFISHSHRDQKTAIGLAGWLHKIFGITSFIDSCVWGYADDLLKIIDNDFCVKAVRSDGSVETYNYAKRNQSTAHVHMILNTALHKMIDDTECLLFLNTPNSLLVDKVVNGDATASPWIYSELVFSKLVRKKKLAEYRGSSYFAHDSMNSIAQLKVEYNVSLDHMYELNDQELMSFWLYGTQKNPEKALDDLYSNKQLFGTEVHLDG